MIIKGDKLALKKNKVKLKFISSNWNKMDEVFPTGMPEDGVDYASFSWPLLRLILESAPATKNTWLDKLTSSKKNIELFLENEVLTIEDALDLTPEQLKDVVPQAARLNKIKQSLDRYFVLQNCFMDISILLTL